MSNHRRLLDAFLLAFRPARWSVFGFRFVPLLLLAAGVGAVVYGGFYHRIAVTETHEEQISVAVPVEQPMPPPMPPDAPPGMSPFPPEAFAPPVKFIQAMKTTRTTSEEWELAVNRAVTVAGMIRDPEGEILRVSGATEGPGFCPT